MHKSFYSEVAPELQTRSDCLILLTVKDYDVVGSDEFMGDAVICFDEIPRGDTVSITDLEQIHLNLSSPSSEGNFLTEIKVIKIFYLNFYCRGL